jgi:hypothetical protein
VPLEVLLEEPNPFPSEALHMYLNILDIVNEKVPHLLQYWIKLFP